MMAGLLTERVCECQGQEERQRCFDPMLEELESHFPDSLPRHRIRVCVPGVGLGRLSWEVAQRGFSAQGNEFSYYMLLCSNFILNAGLAKEELTLYPYVLQTSNTFDTVDQLMPVKVRPHTSCSIVGHLIV